MQAEWTTYFVVMGFVSSLALGLWCLNKFNAKKGKRSAIVTRAGAAALELQTILEPSKRHVIEVKDKQLRKELRVGDPPSR